MARKSKKRSPRKAGYYIIEVLDADPVIVVARSRRLALAAVVSVRLAGLPDLMNAGKYDYRRIDTTVTPDVVQNNGVANGSNENAAV